MRIVLSPQQVEAALPRIETGLIKYLWLQEQVLQRDVLTDREFRRKFNAFYRVRRSVTWQNAFYGLLQSHKGTDVQFTNILDELHTRTGRYEASFASKLVATINPQMPVIDSVVLRNLGIRLPWSGSQHRLEEICTIYDELTDSFRTFLASEQGRHLVARFLKTYGPAVTEVKMLDLVLWQTRGQIS